MLSILNVAYPFAPVSPDSVGGAEQIVSALDRALVEVGHRSIVIACEGSQTAGTLTPIPRTDGVINDRSRTTAWTSCRHAIEQVLRQDSIDLIHFHGLDYIHYLPAAGASALITLHMPSDHYPDEALDVNRPYTWLHGVSRGQLNGMRRANMLEPIENGVPICDAERSWTKRHFALTLGRICPEKGVHLAMDAAKRADIPLLIAGITYPYASHINYFENEVGPRLDRHCRFIGPVGLHQKRRLLTSARCLLVPSLVPETSSLVAREALSCGTPVVAFARGALTTVIEDGHTGFLVDSVDEMARAISACEGLSASVCRQVAATRFSERRMIGEYLALYERLARLRPQRTAA